MKASVLGLAFAVCSASGLHVTRNLGSDLPWQFGSRFAFAVRDKDFQPSPDDTSLHGPPTADSWGFQWWSQGVKESVKMALYDDQTYSWEQARATMRDAANQSAACDLLTSQFPGPANIVLPLGGVCTREQPCKMPIIDHARRRYWYTVMIDCESGHIESGGVVHIMQNNPGSYMRKEFGVDQIGLFEMFMIITPIQVIFLLVYHVQGRSEESSRVTTAYSVSALLQLAASAFTLTHYARFASDGIGAPYLFNTARACTIMAEVVLMALLVVFASAFTLAPQPCEPKVRETLSRQRQMVSLTFSVLLIANIAVFVWGLYGEDDLADYYAYPYDAAPGAVLAALRIPVVVYFIATTLRTMHLVPELKTHLLTHGVLFAAYILSMPLLLLVAHLLDPWVRNRWIEIPHILALLACQAFMGLILWPGKRRERALSRSRLVPMDGNNLEESTWVEKDGSDGAGSPKAQAQAGDEEQRPLKTTIV